MINEQKSISEIQDFRVYLGESSKPAGLIQHLENERQLGSIQEKKRKGGISWIKNPSPARQSLSCETSEMAEKGRLESQDFQSGNEKFCKEKEK